MKFQRGSVAAMIAAPGEEKFPTGVDPDAAISD